MICVSGRGCLSVMLCVCVCTMCRAFGLWDCPYVPFLLSSQTCNTVFLASWARACRTSSGLAQLIPEFSENSRVRVAADHWPVSLLWHPNFRLALLAPRCPRCVLHALDETTVPNLLIILCSNCPCCVYTQRCSDDVLVALCGPAKPNAWNESGIEFAAFNLFVSDFRIYN